MLTRYLRAEELARFAGVAKSTVLAAIRRGEIPSSRTVGRGTRISVDTARAFLENRGCPIPSDLREERATSIAVVTEGADVPGLITAVAHRAWSITGSTEAYATLLWIGANEPSTVVVDLEMSMLNPFEVIRSVRKFRPATCIVAIGTSRELFDAAIAMGAWDAVDPHHREALASALERRRAPEPKFASPPVAITPMTEITE